ncbi:MAG TPA: alpha-hydroxy acid oxidase [Verrucomicrobiae bacterium]|nr:alpha-hydroxy acid oxidase [Verrucomicrobiae bacterium]
MTRLERLYTIEDLRLAAARRLPRAVFDTIDGGAGDEAAVVRNLEALRAMTLVPRVLTDVSTVDTGAMVLGGRIAFPLLLAPVGFSGLYFPNAERCTAAAAEGTIHVLSVFSTVSLEEVAASAPGRRWFQLYPFGSRDIMRDLIGRARRYGYEALCVTVDVPVIGGRNRDLRSGLRSTGATLPFLLSAAAHPGWSLPYLMGHRPRFKTLEPYLPENAHRWLPLRAPDLNPAFGWSDLEWVVREWQGPVIVKGILHADDAERALQAGAAAIVVSNHGGRQFEPAPSALTVLPGIRERLGDDAEVYADGGVRTGADILKYMAAGANAVLAGRAFVYGLSIAGEAGVRRALGILRSELETAMRLAGITAFP